MGKETRVPEVICENKTKVLVWSQMVGESVECQDGEELCHTNKREQGVS